MDVKTICIVEDEEAINLLLREIIKGAYPDIHVDYFHDIPEDRRVLRNANILVMDCNLPSGYLCDMECFQACDKPKILITGDTTIKCDKEDCVVCYKPFTVTKFLNILQTVMDSMK